ncbi:MAG: hypothetical protein AAGM22_12585 [Acidobacteriota bacterium]
MDRPDLAPRDAPTEDSPTHPEAPAKARALAGRVADFVDDPASEPFDDLVRDVFAFQYARIEPFRRLCQSRGVAPSSLGSWRDVPPVPVAAFKAMALHAAPAKEVFRSSGTTQGQRRSEHHHPFPDLYRRTISALFRRRCLLPGEGRVPILRLVAPRAEVADSSLGFMAEHLAAHFGTAPSAAAMGANGPDFSAAERWARRLEGPGFIVTTAFALAWWLDDLEARGLRLSLPADTRVFETGGFKGRSRELSRGELVARVHGRLGVPAHRVIREYGMSELTGHFYPATLEGGDPDLFRVPHFMRVRTVDPVTLDDVADGEAGLLRILDLSNAGSAMAVLSEDLGLREGGGFRLLGRAAGAELRGCSLTVDELRP